MPPCTGSAWYAFRIIGCLGLGSQRVHVGRWYILRARRGSHIRTYFKAQVYPIYLHRPFGGFGFRDNPLHDSPTGPL